MTILDGKVAIITGASSGIGEAAAKLFASEGAKIVLSARRRDKLKDVAAAIEAAGGQVKFVAGDVRDEAHHVALVRTALDAFGGLDIGFNNAGGTGAMGPIEAMRWEDWRETMDTNLTSAFLSAKHQIPVMAAKGRGSLIFTSSFVGYTAGMPGMGAYAAAKAGIIGLVKVLAVELGPKGVRVNALLPGGTDTPASITNAPGATAETLAFVEGLHALKRMAKPREIAETALHLASDAASFITGSALLVDGGVSICRT